MTVKRIVANIASSDTADARAFYGDILGMNVVMDHGWIVTFATAAGTTPQVSVASGKADRARRCPISPSKSTISTKCFAA